MTSRADDARVAYPLFQAGNGGSTPTSALQLFFRPIDRETFVSLNAAWHSRLPKVGASQFRAIYGAEYEGVFWAVAAWSNPVARLLPQQKWLELRRLAIGPGSPKNTATRMIAWMTRDIKTRFPEVERLISYQDCTVHTGTIYKAAGWKQAETISAAIVDGGRKPHGPIGSELAEQTKRLPRECDGNSSYPAMQGFPD